MLFLRVFFFWAATNWVKIKIPYVSVLQMPPFHWNLTYNKIFIPKYASLDASLKDLNFFCIDNDHLIKLLGRYFEYKLKWWKNFNTSQSIKYNMVKSFWKNWLLFYWLKRIFKHSWILWYDRFFLTFTNNRKNSKELHRLRSHNHS